MPKEVSPELVQYALEQLKKPVKGAPLSKYLKWFSRQAKIPAARAQGHPQFWEPKLLRAFIAMHHMQNDMQMSTPGVIQKADILQQLSSSGLTDGTQDLDDLFDMGDTSSDDDMPEPE